MTDYQIGKVIGVSGDEVIISLAPHDSTGNGHGVPESMSIDLLSESGPVPILVGQPGTFITISLPSGKLLCMVTEIDMRERRTTQTEVRDAVSDGLLTIDEASRELRAIPVGTLDAAGNFERGSDILPTVNAPVFVVSPAQINQIYSSYADGDFDIGFLSLLPSQPAKINLDAFLTRHAAILGQTGGGKSWTVASIIQRICKFPQSTVVLLDLHGEYSKVFGEDADVISASDLELPYWLMNSEELLGLMVDRSESAAPNQIAKFKELLQTAKESHPENKALDLKRITIDTPVYFDFNTILREFERLDTERIQGSRGERNGPLFGEFTRLLMRIGSRLNDRRYDLIFKPKTYNTSASMEALFKRLLGESDGNRKKAVVIDLSPVPFDVRSSIISLILRCLFDFAYWYRRVNGKAFPIAAFADEAHIYLRDGDPSMAAAKHAAERIAKEGRKYGISLTVMSQRPREVSATILSQCSSFLCLRIANPDDQAYVKSLLPDSMSGIATMFSTLRRGECILLGDAVMMPTRIKIARPDPAPNSEDASFYNTWNSLPEDINMGNVLHAWRAQEVTTT